MGTQGVPMNKRDILDAIKEKGHVKAHIAKYLGCTRQTIYTWMNEDEDVKYALEEAKRRFESIRHDIHDDLQFHAYQSALALLQQMDVPTTIFILKTLCGLEQKESGVNFAILDKGSMDESK